jgi:nucleoside-diphosphate-sugar epimerase
MKYIVTGGAGFIGSTLTDKLIEDGHEVVVIDNLISGNRDNVNPRARFLHCDIRDIKREYLYHLIGADVLFHCAALARVQPSIEDPIGYNDANVNGTLAVLDMMRLIGIPKIVYSASSSAYGDTDIFPTHEKVPPNPLSPYGLQKLIGEQYCKVYTECYGIESVCLRYFNVYGERQSLEGAYKLVMGTFIQQVLNDKPMTIRGDGSQRRDFTYVGDVVRANMLAAESKKTVNGEVINIGAGNNVSVEELADMIGGPKMYITGVKEPRQTLADNTRALKLLGWRPRVVLREWIKDYLNDLQVG